MMANFAIAGQYPNQGLGKWSRVHTRKLVTPYDTYFL